MSVKECYDLTACAAVLGAEGAFRCAVGDTVLYGPCHGRSIVCVGQDILKGFLGFGLDPGGTIEECDALGPCAEVVRAEDILGLDVGHAVFICPFYGIGAVGVDGNIVKDALPGLLFNGMTKVYFPLSFPVSLTAFPFLSVTVSSASL